MAIIPYLILAFLIFAGLASRAPEVWVLGRRRSMSRKEYEDQKRQGGGLGNALVRLQGILEPGREQLREAKEERRDAEDESGDPPEPPRISG